MSFLLGSKVSIEKNILFCKNVFFSFYSVEAKPLVLVRENLRTHTERTLIELSNELYWGEGELPELCSDLSKNVERAKFDL